MRIKKTGGSEFAQINSDREQLLLSHHDFYIQEAYNSLRTNVMFSLTDDSDSHVIMVTSAFPNEGKSTTSMNLAYTFAVAGKRTLLIDCDMRKPKIGRLLKITKAKGLSDMLFHMDDAEPHIFRVNEMDLFVLTAGSIPPNPSELLGSARMKRLMESQRQKFEYIILDMPPINVVTDAAVASSLADGTLLVVRSGLSERNAALKAIDQLNRANAKILGAVLTRVNEDNRHHSYSQKYGYGDSYAKASLGNQR